MLGHKLYQVLGKSFEVTGTIRGTLGDISRYGFYKPREIITGVDAMDLRSVEKAIDDARPDAAVNCIGIVRSLADKSGILRNIQLNAMFPHQLYDICRAKNVRLIHISTDCVFSGRKGNYSEADPADAEDIYGKTKFLGEVTGPGILTLRTSFIGRELSGANGLLEWFITNRGKTVPGWVNAIYTGFTTLHLSRIIADIIENHPELDSLYHVSSEPVSKHRLLSLINDAMKLNIKINKSPEPRLDRGLDSRRFREQTGFRPLPWTAMVREMAEDTQHYAEWRKNGL